MEAIEKTYDELSENSSYKKHMNFAKVNMRDIIKILWLHLYYKDYWSHVLKDEEITEVILKENF